MEFKIPPVFLLVLILLLTHIHAYSIGSEGSASDVIDLQTLLHNVSTSLSKQSSAFKELTGKLGEVQGEGILQNLRNISLVVNSIAETIKETTTYAYIARDCSDFPDTQKSGVYRVRPTGWKLMDSFNVYCDMETDGGGWTVFQRRGEYGNPEDYFYKDWKEYRDGFGDLNKEFWLGNDHLSALSRQRNYELRVDIQDGQDKWFANYDVFRVENRKQLYKLTVSGYSGTAGDSLADANNMKFTTKDKDNVGKCAQTYKGAWWYQKCHFSNLNGLNLKGRHNQYGEGINWKTIKGYYYSLAFTEMKIRPADY